METLQATPGCECWELNWFVALFSSHTSGLFETPLVITSITWFVLKTAEERLRKTDSIPSFFHQVLEKLSFLVGLMTVFLVISVWVKPAFWIFLFIWLLFFGFEAYLIIYGMRMVLSKKNLPKTPTSV